MSLRCIAWLVAGVVLAGGVLAGCMRVNVHGTPPAARSEAQRSVRIATYNASLYDDATGGLVARLRAGDAEARKIAAVLQRVRPDIVLINEFDFDAGGVAADLFQRQYLEVAQDGGGDPLRYPHRYLAPVNTGVPSGLDLDRNGAAGGAGRDHGNDAWGYGLQPGQYGMLLLSKYPIDAAAVRSFRLLKWSAMPGARRPRDPATGSWWHPDAVWSQLRLSSKSHWDVPVHAPGGVVHVLASHPTPPVFDGPEDRNGNRNHDEIRLWTDYLSGGNDSWLCDDAGRCGGLAAEARFVVLGDLNNDPVAGDGQHGAIQALLRHPRVLPMLAPRSDGATALAASRMWAGVGEPAEATGDFGAKVGPLRLDYVLPSRGFRVEGSGVFWPAPGAGGADIVSGSDHRLVWVDLR